MRKKISKILIILLYFTPCNIIILAYILFAWSGSYITEKTYYIPETDTYMKIYNPGIYVAFGDSANFTLSQSISYFTLIKVLGAWIVLDPKDKNRIYVDSFEKENNIVKNIIEYKYITNPLFFKRIKLKETDPEIYQIKKPYICLIISEYANGVSINNKNMNGYIDLEPIAEKEYFNPTYFKSKFRWLMFWEKDNDTESSNVYFLFHLNQKNDNGKK